MGLAAATIGAAVVGAGASIYSGSQQASAAKKGANTQLQMYNQTRSDLLPYMNAGTGVLPQINSLLGNGPGGMQGALSTLQNYPGYQWAFGQGEQAVDRSAASRGMLLSGGQLRDVTSFGQGMADQLMNQYYGQLMGVANMGANASAMTGQAGTQAAYGAAQGFQAAGTANAAGTMGAVNGLFGAGGALNQAMTAYGANNAGAANGGLGSGANYIQPSQDYSGVVSTLPSSDIYSDRRLKTDIKRVGRLDSGLPVYTYRFKGSALPQVGVMAQDVEKVLPSAVSEDRSGIKRVNLAQVSRLPIRRDRSMLPQLREAA